MSNEPRGTSVEEISKWIRDAAASESSRSGHHLASTPVSLSETCAFHGERIELSLRRARLKTFVRMAKPFRRLFRNQGAVNDSLIEAVSHLAAENEEMIDQIGDLRDAVRSLQSEKRLAARTEIEGSNAAEGSERDGACV